MKKIILFFLIFSFIVVCISIWYKFINPIVKTNATVFSMRIQPIDLNLIEDGIYSGAFQIRKSVYRIIFIVYNSKITKLILLENAKTYKAKKAEKLLQEIIQKQTLILDSVSGATLSSKAILKAIEIALRKGYSRKLYKDKY